MEKISLLIQGYLNTNDNEIMMKIINRFHPLLQKYARKLYYIEFDDAIQELTMALIIAVQKIHNTENEYACITYISQSVIHAFTKLYRQSQKNAEIQSSNYPLNPSLTGAYDYLFDLCEEYVDICTLLSSLSIKKQKIFKLILKGYTDQEIAALLGCSKQYINRVKRDYRNEIESHAYKRT